MIINNSSNINTYVSIVPIKANFLDTSLCDALSASIQDNLVDQCIVNYRLYNLKSSQLFYHGIVTISGTDYTNWTGDNAYVYTFLLNNLPGLVAAS